MSFFSTRELVIPHDAMKSGQDKKGHTNEPTTKFPTRTLPCNLNRTLNNFDATLRRLHTPWRIRTRLPQDGLHPGPHRLPEIAPSKQSAHIRTFSRPPHSRVPTQLRTYGDVPRPFVIDPLRHTRRIPPGRIVRVSSHTHRSCHRLSPLLSLSASASWAKSAWARDADVSS